MNPTSEISTCDNMTAERLREHWFTGRKVPFWDYNPAKLSVGIEVEYFLATSDPIAPKLATRQQYLDVMRILARQHDYTDRSLPDQPGRISKDTKSGFIAIKPDFAWHILEIALPPRKKIEEVHELLISTFAEVDSALDRVGLRRLDLSCLPEIPAKMDLVDLDRLRGHQPTAPHSDSRFANNNFPALIAATHIHINCSDEPSLALMPRLYSREPEAQKLFTRANFFMGQHYENVRTEFYEQTYGSTYKLRTIPLTIPTSLADYADMMNSSPKIFPYDRFFPVRDMSYIRPTPIGTIEFRSACSYLDVKTLMAIASFRLNQVLFAHAVSHPKSIEAGVW